MLYFKTHYAGLEIDVRDLEERDVSAIVSYWCDSDLEYLRSIGVDTSKLGDRGAIERRFRQAVPEKGRTRRTIVFVAESRDVGLVGYTSLNLGERDEGYAHVHILDESLRGIGLAPFLFLRVMLLFLEKCPVDRIVFQASPENAKVNRLLQKSGLAPERKHLERPDGMARPGFFNVYEVTRSALALPPAQGVRP